VPALNWPQSPMTIVQGFERRYPGSGSIGAVAMWAAWAAETLHYLDDLDQAQAAYPAPIGAHHSDIVDIAHVRWVTGTAITSLDLCAAVLGRVYCPGSGGHELDLRAFQIEERLPENRRVAIDRRRSSLPGPMLVWVDDVLADSRYIDIHGARNRFTHSWLSRHLNAGGPSDHTSRTAFVVRESNRPLNARDLVELSRDLATDHVIAFFSELDRL